MSPDYLQRILERTNSPIIRSLIDDQNRRRLSDEQLCSVLIIELLSYQFASPVRWIDTQN